MWLSQRRQTELEEAAAELGQVTVPGAPAGVALAGERRDVAPAGITGHRSGGIPSWW